MITTAADLHRYLTSLAVFDFNPEHERDLPLYTEMKTRLELPEGEFIKALESRNVSAESYLRTLIAIAQPLAAMYEAIFQYCQEANFLRSHNNTQVQWQTEHGEATLDFSLEHFRVYRELCRHVENANKDLKEMVGTKNKLMDWLASIFGSSNGGPARLDWDWSGLELFRIMDRAREKYENNGTHNILFGGLKRIYIGGKRPERCPQHVEQQISLHPQYETILKEVALVFGDLQIEQVASEFVNLPFWKFRWQVYEIWTLTVVLRELVGSGFDLVRSSDGASLIELGKPSILAKHSESGHQLMYQPHYQNRDGMRIHPDLVVSCNESVSAADAVLIVECKQRIALTTLHVNTVAKNYSAGVSAENGEVIIINYDETDTAEPSATRTSLISSVHPNGKGEKAFTNALRNSYLFTTHAREIWYIDVSMSMQEKISQDLKDFLSDRCAVKRNSGYIETFSFALAVKPVVPHSLEANVALSSLETDENWEGFGLQELYKHVQQTLAQVSGAQVIIVSDLAVKIQDELKRFGNDLTRIVTIDPSVDDWRTKVTTRCGQHKLM